MLASANCFQPLISGRPSINHSATFSHKELTLSWLGSNSMLRQAVCFPKVPWLQALWLEFIHFEKGGIGDSFRLYTRHFTVACFSNYMEHMMGFVSLSLSYYPTPGYTCVTCSWPYYHDTPTLQ